MLSTEDVLINVALEITADYLANSNKKEINSLEVSPLKKDSINWEKSTLNKWNIIEPKDTLKDE